MILFTIILAIVIAVSVIGLIFAIAAGFGIVAVLGDIIIFVFLVWLIVKIFKRKK